MLLSDFLNFVKFGDLDNVIEGIKSGIDPSVSNNWPILLAYSEAKKLSLRIGTPIEDTPPFQIIMYLWQYPRVREKLIYLCPNLNTDEMQLVVNFPTKITYEKTQMEEIIDDDANNSIAFLEFVSNNNNFVKTETQEADHVILSRELDKMLDKGFKSFREIRNGSRFFQKIGKTSKEVETFIFNQCNTHRDNVEFMYIWDSNNNFIRRRG